MYGSGLIGFTFGYQRVDSQNLEAAQIFPVKMASDFSEGGSLRSFGFFY
jgi:hypothetical protein